MRSGARWYFIHFGAARVKQAVLAHVERLLPGSLPETVVRHSRCSVLVVKRNPARILSPIIENCIAMFRKILHTNNDYALTIVRVVLGVVFFAHGAQKALGWFGGAGFGGTMQLFTARLGIPALFAFLAIMAEFLGGLGLIIGLLSRIAALGIAVNMIVAVFKVHAANGLFMNWSGHQRGEGFEFHLLAIAMALLVMIRGGGALSLDRVLDAVPRARYR